MQHDSAPSTPLFFWAGCLSAASKVTEFGTTTRPSLRGSRVDGSKRTTPRTSRSSSAAHRLRRPSFPRNTIHSHLISCKLENTIWRAREGFYIHRPTTMTGSNFHDLAEILREAALQEAANRTKQRSQLIASVTAAGSDQLELDAQSEAKADELLAVYEDEKAKNDALAKSLDKVSLLAAKLSECLTDMFKRHDAETRGAGQDRRGQNRWEDR